MEIKTNTGDIIRSNMVIENDWMYMWSTLSQNGTKMNIKKMPKQGNVNNNQGILDPSKKMDYKCEAWTPNAKQFVVPSNIVFNDITDLMSGFSADLLSPGSESNSNNKISGCEACYMMTDEVAKQECRKSLNCE